jgi:hypothetical protein
MLTHILVKMGTWVVEDLILPQSSELLKAELIVCGYALWEIEVFYEKMLKAAREDLKILLSTCSHFDDLREEYVGNIAHISLAAERSLVGLNIRYDIKQDFCLASVS